MTNYDLLNQDKAKEEGKELAKKHLDMVKDALKDIKNKEVHGKMENKIKELIVKYEDKSLEEPSFYFQYLEFVEDLQTLLI